MKQVLNDLKAPYQFFSTDNVPATNSGWISNCWAAVRSLMESNGWGNVVLVVDEIQKITDKYIGIIDSAIDDKTKEILTV